MKIINNTHLDDASIQHLIEKIQQSNTGNTMYYGKKEKWLINIFGYKIQVQIRYLKRYVEWRFEEIESRK